MSATHIINPAAETPRKADAALCEQSARLPLGAEKKGATNGGRRRRGDREDERRGGEEGGAEKEETLTWYHRTPTVRYGFCSQCGSSLFWHDATRENFFAVPAGCLDQPTGLSTVLNIYTETAGDYYTLDPSLPCEIGDVTHW